MEALTGIQDVHDGVDAVVHLAAVPAPGLIANAATFANNAPASYNVFSAARLAGIRNVVWASSETVLGLPFDTPPPYLPVDEEYPEPMGLHRRPLRGAGDHVPAAALSG